MTTLDPRKLWPWAGDRPKMIAAYKDLIGLEIIAGGGKITDVLDADFMLTIDVEKSGKKRRVLIRAPQLPISDLVDVASKHHENPDDKSVHSTKQQNQEALSIVQQVDYNE